MEIIPRRKREDFKRSGEIFPATILTRYVKDGVVTQAKIYGATAGDLIEVVADTEGYSSATTYTKRKEVSLGRAGTYRINFDIRTTDETVWAYGRVYRNGSAVGTERIRTDTTYGTYSEDISGWSSGDLCQLYIHGTSALDPIYWRNFRIKSSNALIATVTLDS